MLRTFWESKRRCSVIVTTLGTLCMVYMILLYSRNRKNVTVRPNTLTTQKHTAQSDRSRTGESRNLGNADRACRGTESPFVAFNKCEQPPQAQSRSMALCNATDSAQKKTILFWTKYYGGNMWWKMDDRLGNKAFQSSHCRCHNCVLSADRSKLKEADLLLFYFFDDPNWPMEKYKGQLYAHFIHEPPSPDLGWSLKQRKYDEKIDLAINYRYDADLYVAYNTIVRSEKGRGEYIPKIPFKQKTKSIVWPVSHCKAASKRDDYVKELQKYIDVDIFGGCGTKRCPRSDTHGCYRQWEKDYKFYLSFENNICVDYITEKMFQPLKYELIPIVLGGGNYTRDAPPHSVINVRDFSSPEKLAQFLKFLSTNETEYFKYFKWKWDYDFVSMPEWLMCKLCEGLHTDYFHKLPERTPYSKRWVGNNGEYCDNQFVNRSRKLNNW